MNIMYMDEGKVLKMVSKTQQLMEKGVKIHNPDTLDIGEEVNLNRISGEGVILYSGCRIYGDKTLILPGAKLGYEGPVTTENCYIGPRVELKGGFFQKAVFLDDVVMGFGAHVREGTILEEQASVAHTVALKQTILFPFVTLGSLINFCDCLMAGGTSRKNHSEVGSSYIHFNFTPNQDKATASLLGDVPRGVMLNQTPIFLGGQGGLVGPCRLEYGTVLAAGSICRKDELRPDRLIQEGGARSANVIYPRGLHLALKRIVVNNINYIANLMALRQWYAHVRSEFVGQDFTPELFEGLTETLQIAIQERIARLLAYCRSLPVSGIPQTVQSNRMCEMYNNCAQLERLFLMQKTWQGNTNFRDSFLEAVHHGISESGRAYLSVIQGISEKSRESGTAWLQGMIDYIVKEALEIFPLLAYGIADE
jgi:bifunctional UDP-N-acetylglucosamine pyrophosphorylase / glucosamine-1-phosphate N-acetyltransferase